MSVGAERQPHAPSGLASRTLSAQKIERREGLGPSRQAPNLQRMGVVPGSIGHVYACGSMRVFEIDSVAVRLPHSVGDSFSPVRRRWVAFESLEVGVSEWVLLAVLSASPPLIHPPGKA